VTERALIARRYHAKSVLITGGTGFIGTHLGARLVSYGAQVVAFGRHAPGGTGAVECIPGDVRNETAVNRVIDRRFYAADISRIGA
jgi:nucleoside-diphosphate-sugar epimerase